MITFRVVRSPDKIVAGLRRFRESIAVPTQLLAGWGAKLVNWTRERITAGVDVHGKAFVDLATSTVKRRGGNSKPIDTGHAGGLLDSITYRIGAPMSDPYPLPAGYIAPIGPTANVLEVGATVVSSTGSPYPAFVNFGTSNGVPARQWSGIGDENRPEMESDFASFVREKLQEAFSV